MAKPEDRRAISGEIDRAESPDAAWRRRLRAWRGRLEGHPRLRSAYRIVIGVVGTALVVVGIVLLVIPGPGWFCVFLGLAVLATEFDSARRVASGLKRVIARFYRRFAARRRGPDGPEAAARSKDGAGRKTSSNARVASL